jgi:hypothetical protein
MASTDTITTSSSTATNDDYEKLKRKNPSLTMEEYNKYNSNKTNYYKGTIAVCVTYSVFALILLLLSIFSEKAKEVIGDTIMPFTITFVIGTIIIVVLLTIQITTFKPYIPDIKLYDRDVCPNHWNLEETPKALLDTFSPDIKNLMRYRCVPPKSPDGTYQIYPLNSYTNADTNPSTKTLNTYSASADYINANIYNHKIVYGTGSTFTNSDIRYGVDLGNKDQADKTNNPAKYNLTAGVSGVGGENVKYLDKMYRNNSTQNINFVDSAGSIINTTSQTMGTKVISNSPGDTNNVMMCDEIYPNYISAQDYKDFPSTPNKYRCLWSQQCGIPWTTACPNPLATLDPPVATPAATPAATPPATGR